MHSNNQAHVPGLAEFVYGGRAERQAEFEECRAMLDQVDSFPKYVDVIERMVEKGFLNKVEAKELLMTTFVDISREYCQSRGDVSLCAGQEAGVSGE